MHVAKLCLMQYFVAYAYVVSCPWMKTRAFMTDIVVAVDEMFCDVADMVCSYDCCREVKGQMYLTRLLAHRNSLMLK